MIEKTHIKNSKSHDTASIATIAAAIVAVSVMSFATTGTAAAAGKGSATKAPAPSAAALTAQEQIDRNRDVRGRRPKEAYSDKTCQGPRRPPSCNWQHQH